MNFNLYEEGIQCLKKIDNPDWINKITCWIKKENEYNIYVFQVKVENQEEIEKYHETITSAIAVYFQAELKKAIEKWNIYMVFTCKQKVDCKVKLKIEQDKYAARKVVWDNLNEAEMNNREYISKRLFSLDIKENLQKKDDKDAFFKKIKEIDFELYEILKKQNISITDKAVIYIGDDMNE